MANQGILFSKKGFRYEGNWKENMRHGNGKMHFDSGKTYVGQFVNNKREGEGQ